MTIDMTVAHITESYQEQKHLPARRLSQSVLPVSINPLKAQPNSQWFLLHTKPRRELIALTNLERQGYTCYLPMMTVEKIRRNKAETIKEAMFPRYLFIHLDTDCQGQSWAPIRSTFGVSQIVRFGDQLATVQPQLVEHLRNSELNQTIEPLFKPGDKVTILNGPFAGIEAIYQTTNPEKRALILLEILASQVTMPIDPSHLLKI
jgi:transcriptional antiterminator RfaH